MCYFPKTTIWGEQVRSDEVREKRGSVKLALLNLKCTFTLTPGLSLCITII